MLNIIDTADARIALELSETYGYDPYTVLSGQDMTSFIIAAAFEKSETVMERHQRIELTAEGFSRLHQILADSATAQPTQALRDLMRGADAERGD